MGTGPPPGGTVAAVWERAGRMTKVTFAGTAAFGARTSAGGRPLWDRKAETLGIPLWDSIRWLRFSAGEWLELEALPGYQAANGWSP